MEEIVSIDGEVLYLFENEYIPRELRKSLTPLYGIIKIDGLLYQCVPGNAYNLCDGCVFYNGDQCCDANYILPCSHNDRNDGIDCIFKEVYVSPFKDKDKFTTDDLKSVKTYRFKNEKD